MQQERNIKRTADLLDDLKKKKKGETHTQQFTFDISKITRGRYFTRYVFFNKKNEQVAYEDIEDAAGLVFRRHAAETGKRPWNRLWGSIRLGNISLLRGQNNE